MKTVSLNDVAVKIPARTERGLRRLVELNFIGMKTCFYEGGGSWNFLMVPSDPKLRAQVGVTEHKKTGKDALTKKEKKFFADNPHAQIVITGDKKIITSILAQVDGE